MQARTRTALITSLVALGFAVLAALAALPVRAQQKAPPVVLLFDEQENVKEKRSDTNGDGRYDEYVFFEQGKPVRAEQDSNHDGRMDTKLAFGPDGQPKSQERDSNGDGKPDQWIEFAGGAPALQKDDLDFDGRPESSTWYEAAKPARREEDANGDGRVDRRVQNANGKRNQNDRNQDQRKKLNSRVRTKVFMSFCRSLWSNVPFGRGRACRPVLARYNSLEPLPQRAEMQA